MSGPESEDPRMNHIKMSAQQVLNFDIADWRDMIWKEENQAIIKDFLDTPTTSILLVYFNVIEKLALSTEIPKRGPIPKRLCFFLKSTVTVSNDNYKREIDFGNIRDCPLRQFKDLFGEVISPIFSNPLNNRRWPEEIAEDNANHIEDFHTVLSYHVGVAEEKTFLPVLTAAKKIEHFNVDELSERDNFNWELLSVLNAIIEMLSNWIPVVKEVLNLSPERILSEINQEPTSEIEFWNERTINLQYIHNQVNSDLTKKMVLALEKTKNVHLSNFKKLLQDVAEGLDESREILAQFRKVDQELKELEQCPFPNLQDLLPETIESVTTAWCHSKYYRTVPSRVIVLLKKLAFLVIRKVHTFLDPETLFKRQRDEARMNVKLSLHLAKLFLESYYDCREKKIYTKKDNKPYPWEFPDLRVFTQFKQFVERLDEIHEIFKAADVYFNIPSKKLNNIQHAPYRRKLEKLQSKFSEAYNTFLFCAYNPLDIENTAFKDDYVQFSKTLEALDPKLGIIVGQLCLACVPAEDAYEIMNLFEGTLERPITQEEFRKTVSSHVTNIYLELLLAKQNCIERMAALEESDKKFVYKNLPPISGALQWSLDLQNKLNTLIENLKKSEEYFEKSKDYDYTFRTYEEVKHFLSQYEENVASKWKYTLDTFNEKITEPVIKSDEKGFCFLNYDFLICWSLLKSCMIQ